LRPARVRAGPGADKGRAARLPRRHGDTPDELTLWGMDVQARAARGGAADSSLGVDDRSVQRARTVTSM